MDAKLKCLADDERLGLKSGTVYPVLAFGQAGAVLANDDGKITHVGYTAVNDSECWELQTGEKKPAAKPEPAKAEPVKGDT